MTKPHYCRKCLTKPKAHYWMFGRQGDPSANTARCKYCGKEREFTHRNPYDPLPRHNIHANVIGTKSGSVQGEKL